MITKNTVFCYVTPCSSCKNRRFGETYRLRDDGSHTASHPRRLYSYLSFFLNIPSHLSLYLTIHIYIFCHPCPSEHPNISIMFISAMKVPQSLAQNLFLPNLLLHPSTLCSQSSSLWRTKKQKQTPRPLVRKRTISTERPPLVDEILVPTLVDRGVSRGQRDRSPTAVNLSFLDRGRYFSFK
jgi:hypothetical protein